MTTNHPANGPVSLVRLHHIREILSKAAAQSDGGNLGYAMADAVKVIDGSISAFDADPQRNPVLAYADSYRDMAKREVESIPVWSVITDLERNIAPLYATPPSPVVPDEDPRDAFERTFKMPKHVTRCGTGYAVTAYSAWLAHDFVRMWEGWNACRAAMLQGAEPASNCDELPLDYLQGHKDGLEWAAQLAEANHPQTGDWLYDDPIELARAIRKGPDIPEFKSVSVDEDDNFYSWFGRFWYENYQKNNYTTSAKQMLGTMAEFAYRAGRESAALAGNSPVTPGCWCRACRPVTMSDMRFVVCPECGNKRCPHANDHRHYCTGSNEPGQVGSAYPAAPQQEVK